LLFNRIYFPTAHCTQNLFLQNNGFPGNRGYPGESINHPHIVMHFSGNEKTLDKIATRMLGAGLEKINKSFEVSHC
jgi:hypothetical protein